MGWISVGALAGVLLLTSIAILIVAWRILGAVRRSERAGDERLEILREQQQRLAFLNEERRQLLRELEHQRQELEHQRQEMEHQRQELVEQRRRLALPPAPPDAAEAVPEPAGGAQKAAQRPWWRRLFGG